MSDNPFTGKSLTEWRDSVPGLSNAELDALAAGVAFFFKQWGEWFPKPPFRTLREDAQPIKGKYFDVNRDDCCLVERYPHCDFPDRIRFFGDGMIRVGKKAAGRELDGRTWDEWPGDA